MFRNYKELNLILIPRQERLRVFLLGSLLAGDLDMTWLYLSHQYPRRFTEMISDEWRLYSKICIAWLTRRHISQRTGS